MQDESFESEITVRLTVSGHLPMSIPCFCLKTSYRLPFGLTYWCPGCGWTTKLDADGVRALRAKHRGSRD